MSKNRRVLLASRPSGWVSEANFKIEDAPLPTPAEGEVLSRTCGCLSIPICAAA